MGQRPEKRLGPKMGLDFPASLINFVFPLRTIFLMWVGEGGGGGYPGPQTTPPPPTRVSLSNSLYSTSALQRDL